MRTYLLSVLSILCLTACDYTKSQDLATNTVPMAETEEVATTLPVKAKSNVFTDFIYDVGPRFGAIKKKDVDTLRSFNDLIADEFANRIVYYKSVSIIVLDGEEQTDEKITVRGNDGNFTAEQLQILQSVDYSTNMLIMAEYREKSFDTGELEDSEWTPYMTVVPEKQARYTFGKDVLKEFLKIKSEASRADVDPEKLRPAKLFFTVTKTGGIENVTLDRHSGYPAVDETMIKLIKETANAWEPAENAKGEKVAQELVVSFGLMGC